MKTGDNVFAQAFREAVKIYSDVRLGRTIKDEALAHNDYLSSNIAPFYKWDMELEEMENDLLKKTAPICKRPTLFSDVENVDVDPSILTQEMTKLFTKQARLYATAINEISPGIYGKYREKKDEIALRRAVREKIKEVPLTIYAKYLPANVIAQAVETKERKEAERKKQEEELAKTYEYMSIHFFS